MSADADPHPPGRARVFWSDRPDRPEVGPPLSGHRSVDLAVIGAGYTGLWTALQAIEEEPGRRVMVLEAESVGSGASTRNGGFCDASLTHGPSHGFDRWPDEMVTLTRLAGENLAGLFSDVERWGIEADLHRVDELSVATAEWQFEELAEEAGMLSELGIEAELLDRDATLRRLTSPTYRGGLAIRGTLALVDPARLVWGLAATAEAMGVEVMEHSPVTSIDDDARPTGGPLTVRTDGGTVDADRVVVATNAWAGPSSSAMRRRIIPVYDHVLATEPLTQDQWEAVGWRGGEGVADSGNRFHYYRPTDDGRIIWGGWDANYYFGSGIGPAREHRPSSHHLLAQHFRETFPQLGPIRFTHRWAGPIGTTSRFTAGWGRQHDGRSVWVGGYTGLGVGASRFAARVALDLVDGRSTERSELGMVRSKPFPFPPEPLRWGAVTLTKRAMVRADEHDGRRGLLLAALDRLGLGFDS